jgi:hypothetical protein
MKAESVYNEFTNEDTIFINIEFNSITSCEVVKKQAQLFLNGTRVLSDNHYSNLKIGIRKSFVFYKKVYERQSKEETRQLLLRAIKEMSLLAEKLRGIRDGSINPELGYEGNKTFLRASRFGIDPENRWYDVDQKGRKTFNHEECGKDILGHELKDKIVTEYRSGLIHPFIGDRYLVDGEPFFRSLIQCHAYVDPLQINKVIEYIRNMSRIVDPKKMGKTMEELMPVPSGLIPLDNGLFEISTKTLRKHSPDYYYVAHLPRNYIPGGKSSKFRNLLETMFTGDPEKDKKITQIYEIIAWTITDGYIPQGSAILIGSGGEGKSIIISVITDLLGSENVGAVSIQDIERDKFKRAYLYGKFANLISEAGGTIRSELYKKFTDYSPITTDNKNGHNFTYRSRAKWIIATNELPETKNDLRAFHRRTAVFIMFENYLEKLLSPREISKIVEDLKNPHELDLIFSEVLDNYLIAFVERKKFTGQLSLSESEEQYKKYSNPSSAYINERHLEGKIFIDFEEAMEYADRNKIDKDLFSKVDQQKGDPSLITIKKIIERDAKKWAKKHKLQEDLIDTVKLGKALELAGYPNITCEKKVEKTPLRAWSGVFIAPINNDNLNIKPNYAHSVNKILPNERENLDEFINEGNDRNIQMSDNKLNESQVTVMQNETLPDNSLSVTGKADTEAGGASMLPHMSENENVEKEGTWQGGVTNTIINQESTRLKQVATDFGGALPDTEQMACSDSEKSKDMLNQAFSETNTHDTSAFVLNKSREKQKIILDILKKILNEKNGTKIECSLILENWPVGSKVIVPTLEDLNEKILPTMAGDGLIKIHNGTFSLTGKELEEIHYVLVSVLEDLPEIAWKDRNYHLHKGDIVHIPEEIADLLVQGNRALRIISLGDSETQVSVLKMPITKEEAEQAIKKLHERGIHLKATDTGISIYGDKFNIAVPVTFYRQNTTKVDQAMEELGFGKENSGTLNNVFFSRSLKRLE